MQQEAAFEEVDQNLRESFLALTVHRPSAEVREWPGLKIVSLGVEFQMFNAAFISAPVKNEDELSQLVAIAAVHFEARRQAWALWICEGWLGRGSHRRAWKALENAGLRLGAEMPGMCGALPMFSVHAAPGLRFERVESERSRIAFCEIGSSCFRVPPAWFSEVFDAALPGRENFVCWVAWLGSEPVATAATVIHGRSIGLYNLAVVPTYRHRGYGESALRFALEHAARTSGLQHTVLQSTSVAIRLYERLGYRSVTRFRVYTS